MDNNDASISLKDKMYIDVEGINSSIDQLSEIIKRTQTIFDSQKELFDKLSKVWGGTTGEKVNSELSSHAAEYDLLLSNMNNKLTFIKNVREAYVKTDVAVSTKIDENANL